MTLNTSQPIAGVNTVQILVNDDFFVPQAGLLVPATLTSAVSGPYDIIAGQDSLTITSPAGSFSFSFNVQTISRFAASDVVQALNQAKISSALASVTNGHLSLTDFSQVGPDSFISVTGTAAQALGFGTAFNPSLVVDNRNWQRKARGVQIYPGWQIVVPTGLINIRTPQFLEPIRTNPVFSVTYSTYGQTCRRCGANLKENDARFDTTGQMLLIVNENLLYQAALKIILTDSGSNPYHSWYGSLLNTRIGSKAISGVAAMIGNDVRSALANLQSIQTAQAQYQTVPLKEKLYTIKSVNVIPHTQDPTTFYVDVAVTNASNDPINLTVVFTVPGAVALMGSNGLFLGNSGLPGSADAPPPMILTS